MSEFKNFHDWQAEKAPLIARVVRAEAEVERLRAVSDELQGWRDRAVASCIKRRCDSRDRRAGELETEVERLRAAAPIIHTLDVDDLVREVGRKVDAWTHDGSSHHDLKAACAEAISRTVPEVTRPVDIMTVAEAIESVRQRTPPNYRVDSRDLARAAIRAIGAQGFEVENTGTAPPVQTQGLEDSHGQSASEDQRVSGSLSRGDRRDERNQSPGRTPGGARGEAESDSGSGRTVAGDRSNAAPAGRDEPREVRRQAHDFLNGEGACAPVCAPSNAPALPDNADPGDEAQPASPTDEGALRALVAELEAANIALSEAVFRQIDRAVISGHERLARIAELEKALIESRGDTLTWAARAAASCAQQELEQIRRDLNACLGRIDRALGAGGAK